MKIEFKRIFMFMKEERIKEIKISIIIFIFIGFLAFVSAIILAVVTSIGGVMQNLSIVLAIIGSTAFIAAAIQSVEKSMIEK